MKANEEIITRATFVRKYMEYCGMSYVEACRAYDCMVNTFQNAVLRGVRVNIGRVGAVQPVWVQPREVRMGFRRQKGGIVKVHSRYFLDGRYRYKFRLFRQFIRNNELQWFR
jgi:hypothetical protein